MCGNSRSEFFKVSRDSVGTRLLFRIGESGINRLTVRECTVIMIKSPREFFENILPKKFEPAKAGELDAVIQMNITGADGGNWTITVKDQKMDIKEGIHSSPMITVKVADTDFVDLVNGNLNAISAFMAGKIEFQGSISMGLKLVDLGII